MEAIDTMFNELLSRMIEKDEIHFYTIRRLITAATLRRNRVQDSVIENLLNRVVQQTTQLKSYRKDEILGRKELTADKLETIHKRIRTFYDQPLIVAKQHRN